MEAKERGYWQNAPPRARPTLCAQLRLVGGPFYGIGTRDDLSCTSRLLPIAQPIARTVSASTIETEGLRGGVVYHDGQFDDARLAINMAKPP